MSHAPDQQLLNELNELRTTVTRCHRFEQILAGISTRLINLDADNEESGIVKALEELGLFLGTDRIYIFLFNDKGAHIESTYEWCADGIEHHPFEALHNAPVTAFPWSMERFRAGEAVHLVDRDSLPGEAGPERTACEQFSIMSYVNAPLFSAGRLRGWGGLDSVKVRREWRDQEVLALRLVGEVVINVLVRFREQKVREELRQLRGLLPICATCKRIRDEEGHWHQIETYIRDRTEADFSHGICPECAEREYNIKL